MASEEEIVKYVQKVNKAEREIAALQKELESLSKPENLLKEGYASPELEQLRIENQKLQYQRTHLKRNLEDETKRVRDCALDVRGIIEDIFTLAIHAAYPQLANPVILVVPSAKFADYQCNSAMSMAQQLGALTGNKVNPREVSQAIVNQLPESAFFEKIEIAGPGFINIFLKKDFVSEEISFLLKNGVKPPKVQKKRVVVDFSSPNIAKEMHVGHLRSTIIGESICRLMDWVGHNVLRLSHIGDWGTQFGMLIAHMEDKVPNLLESRLPLEEIQGFYKDSKVRFDSDEAFKKRSLETVVKLQARDPFYYKAWKIICDISMEANRKIYDRLDVTVQDRGESYYQDRMVKLVPELEDLGMLEVDEFGRKVMFLPGFDLPLIVVKSDGGFTYDTSDLSTIRNRVEEELGEWVIYVVGLEQSLHLEMNFCAAAVLGWTDKSKHRIDHVGFGVVLGEDKKKLKSRSGDSVKLHELLDEGIKRVGDKIVAMGRDKDLTPEEVEKIKRSVAYGCIKYADLSHNRTHDYVFSFDRMLDDRGNTAAYLLYALTRIRSIARSANISPAELKAAAKTTAIDLSHEAEWKLAKSVLRFSEVITRVLEDLMLHSLCDYMYELTTTFTEFYDKCYCLEKDKAGKVVKVNTSRLLLCEATASIISMAFHLLGIDPLDKM